MYSCKEFFKNLLVPRLSVLDTYFIQILQCINDGNTSKFNYNEYNISIQTWSK
jgi:hypothetical protein